MIKSRFPVSTSHNMGKAHSPKRGEAARQRLRLPTWSETAAETGMLRTMKITAVIVMYSVVLVPRPSYVVS